MTLKVRIPRLPHLPQYKSPQNQVNEYDTRKQYEEDLHRALSELELVVEDADHGGGGFVTNVSGVAPIVVTNGATNAVVSHATSGVTATTYGDASNVPQLTVDAKGHVTAVTNVAITGGGLNPIVAAKIFGRT